MRHSTGLICGAALAVALALIGAPAKAQEGLANLHSWTRIGNRICFTDHFHNGSGSGATQKQAFAVAIQDWAGFTGWEYGAHWAVWALAETKRARCTPSGTVWSCEVEARPCKSARR